MDEKETSMYEYQCLIDILAEMVTVYTTDHIKDEKIVISSISSQS